MQNTNFWHKLHLHGKKIACLLLLLAAFALQEVSAQKITTINLPESDTRWLHYGFLIGLHSSNYRTTYADEFVTSEFDTVHSIMATNSPGFSLGFILNLRLAQYLDFRLTPKVGFYEHELEYRYTNRSSERLLMESTQVEFPILLKYKSQRRGNFRMYMVGGVNPWIEAKSKNSEQEVERNFNVKNANLSLEFGFGADIYFPLFKFSPEIRFSKGLINQLEPVGSRWDRGLEKVSTQTITLYLQFSD